MAFIRGLAYASVVLFAATCCRPPPRSYGIQRIRSAAPSAPATGAFWLFADSQIHNAPGAATRSKSAPVDEKISVAIRPPSLDLWAEVVLSDASARMREEDPGIPAFFLGDAANVSCIDEYARFLTATGKDLAWFGVMGNHDGYYMGNFTFEPRGALGQNSWRGACAIDGERAHRPWAQSDRLTRLERDLWKIADADETHVDQGVLTKAHAIWMYLDELRQRQIIKADPLDCNNWIPVEWQPSNRWDRFSCSTWSPKADSYRVFRATGTYRLRGEERSISLVASIDSATVLSRQRTQPWHSFLVQDVELLDRNHTILIDTSDYLNMPPTANFTGGLTLLASWRVPDCWKQEGDYSTPGACGEVSSAQIDEIAGFLSRARKASPGSRYFVLGHHPWQSLRRDSASRMTTLLAAQPGFITYISAHKHLAAATLGTDADYHWEVNLGSTTDWPMEYAKISYWLSDKPPELRVDVRKAVADGGACPYGGPTDPAAREHDQREMDYKTPNAYVTRALEVYRHILDKAISGLPDDAPVPACSIDGSQMDLRGVLDRLDDVRKNPALDLREKRLLLDQVSQCDRGVLRNMTGICAIEIDCAIWASKLEFDMNSRAQRIRLSDRAPETFQIIAVPRRGTGTRQ